jgi:ADP-ribose pyrophosphatase YjhB (NUDIX family)
MVNSGESIREAAARECFEESGISAAPESLSYAGCMLFYNHEKGEVEPNQMLVHFFLAHIWYGRPTQKDPSFVNLRWYRTSKLPLDHMMAADPYFVPDMLQGKQMVGRAHYLNSAEVRQKLLYPGTAVLVSKSEVTIDVP